METNVRILLWIIVAGVVVALAGAGLLLWLNPHLDLSIPGMGVRSHIRGQRAMDWLHDPAAHADWAIHAGQRCADAPFLLPTDGYVGFLWDDSFRVGHRHQGLDIFGGTQIGETPVVAAYDGYLTRLADWKSTVIIRVPDDPLKPGRQIWTYYTHMADSDGASLIAADFPPGTQEVFVKTGTLLGHQGNFSGDPVNPVGVHLHFSIVKDNGQGKYLNELEINNTLDPSPYLGLNANAHTNTDEIPLCAPAGSPDSGGAQP